MFIVIQGVICKDKIQNWYWYRCCPSAGEVNYGITTHQESERVFTIRGHSAEEKEQIGEK